MSPPPIRLLIADDEDDYRETLARLLLRRGFEVVRTAVNGEQALAWHAKETFDVILLDLRMPVLDGLGALAGIRRGDPFTQVLILSGHADLPSACTALQAGAANVLLKPCPVETLLSALEDAAEVTRAARGLAAHDPPPPLRR